MPSAEWQSMWGRNLEFSMSSFARAQQPCVAAFINVFMRVITALFCEKVSFARCTSADGVLVRASDGGPPVVLGEEDERALQNISEVLRNPYIRISLPVLFWHAGECSHTHPRTHTATHAHIATHAHTYSAACGDRRARRSE